MDQKEALRQEIEVKLIEAKNQVNRVKEIMIEAEWDFVTQEDVEVVAEAILRLMGKFNARKG